MNWSQGESPLSVLTARMGGQCVMMVPGGRARGQTRNFGEVFHSDAR